MPPVRLSKSAERWFLNKVAELTEVNPAAARRLIERLERPKGLLSSFPQMNERRVLEGTRKVSMPPLLTIRARDGMVEIAAIRDARQKTHTLQPSCGPQTTMTMKKTTKRRIEAA
jgi:plasmid stabilization system protein ParE